jgi:ubiquinone/menaquinone biosynthesis C-methylase UbiE
MEMTERQARELEYHKGHYKGNRAVDFDVLKHAELRWWNAYWSMFAEIKKLDVRGKRVLVVGCGAGEDAIRMAVLGATVHGFDLSPEALEIARESAKQANVTVLFDEMPAEKLTYPDRFFDLVLARDILHHVDIPLSLAEMKRVSKPGALWVIDEIYSHSITDTIRNSWAVKRVLYPAMQRFIYGPGKPYITEDERKLTERDIAAISGALDKPRSRYFNFIVTRLIPDRWIWASKVDRVALMAAWKLGRYLAGRILMVGSVK